MIEVLILSMLGLAGSALGGAVADDDVDNSFDGEDRDDPLPRDTSLLMPEGAGEPVVVAQDTGNVAPADTLSEDAQYGSGADDLLTDWHGDVELYGGGGDDKLQGGFDGDRLSVFYGGDGDDTIRDGDNAALIYGGDGDDRITSGHGQSEIDGGAGDDVIDAGIQTDTVYGGAGNDRLVSVGSGDSDDPDLLYGGVGDDDLHAYGTAKLYGGAGADRFTTYANTWVEHAPVIADFNPAVDTLCVEIDSHEGMQELSDFQVEVQDFADGTGASVFVDGYEVMRVPGGQGIRLEDVELKLV
ncbi:calcium-binding protein [Neptunicoccus sediminis]|uniref:calcium-binding protein n=1 Tax=Neptunicoccus sediminis TaxID=1892596 RepID=UPI0008460193|nr:calcium-binding protein [Neptunicoccus sediminis]